MEDFNHILSSLLSPDNATRAAAELRLEEAKKNPDALANALISALRHSSGVEQRSLCAVLIRRVRDDTICHAGRTNSAHRAP
jgi:hypothetical protein